MRSFKNFRGIVENAPVAPVSNQKEQELAAKINAIVDSWTQELINLLLNSGSGAGAKRGLWDRFKGTMSNFWHGRDGDSNPYKWVNKFGDQLGQKESFSLEEYKVLKETCDTLEAQINEDVENLKIFQLIKGAAAKLKQDLHTALASDVKTPEMAPSSAPATQSRPKTTSAVPAEPLAQSSNPAKASPDSEIEPELYQRHKHLPPVSTWAHTPSQAAKEAPEEKVSGIEQPSQNPMEQKPVQKGEFYTNPPTTGLAWENLNASQIEKWNKYGGGTGNSLGGDCFKFTKGTPITKLPYILRIGDPRIDIIRSQKLDGPDSFNQKYLDKERLSNNSKLASIKDFNPEKHCVKKNAAVWNSLIRNKRVEGEESFGEPIKDEQDLRNRIEVIKQNMAREPKDSSATKPFNPVDSPNMDAPTIAPSVTSTKEDRTKQKEPTPEVAPAALDTPKRGRGRPRKKVVLPSWLKGDEEEKATEMPEPHVPHISPTPELDAEEEPVKDIDTARQEAEEALKGGSPAVFKKYFNKLSKANTVEELENLKAGILHMKKLEDETNNDELQELPEWTLKDTTNFYRKKFFK